MPAIFRTLLSFLTLNVVHNSGLIITARVGKHPDALLEEL